MAGRRDCHGKWKFWPVSGPVFFLCRASEQPLKSYQSLKARDSRVVAR